MSLNPQQLQRIAELAKLNISESEQTALAEKLNGILALNEHLKTINTSAVAPLSHPLELSQSLREDVVTETNQREAFQKIAPLVKAGLYLVPQVIETE